MSEAEVVEELRQRFIKELGYPEDCVQTKPQYRIRLHPSDTKGYPVDIAVFRDPRKRDVDLVIVGECKQPRRRDGIEQLKVLLRNSSAEAGVWYRSVEYAYIGKTYDERGRIQFIDLPSLPRFGQSIKDIGRIKRKDLVKPLNLRQTFVHLHNRLAATAVGVTRAIDIAEQLIYVLFCKLHDEVNKKPEEDVEFCTYYGETPEQLKERIVKYFNEKVKAEYSEVFGEDDSIKLDPTSLREVVGALQDYTINALVEEDVDAISDAFEVIIGPTLKGERGQFFTPKNVIRMIFEALDPKPDPSTGATPLVIDPACGTGRFLIEAMRRIWMRLEEEARERQWSSHVLMNKKERAAMRLYGIDKDAFLAKVARCYMALLGNARENVFCVNSLDVPERWGGGVSEKVRLGSFDIVVTNPPHGARLVETDREILEQYRLARRWEGSGGTWRETGALKEKEACVILFLERCLQLLKPGGIMAIVFPETYLGMPSYRWIPYWLLENYRVRAVVAMPEELFQPYTHNKTCVLFVEKSPPKAGDLIFLSDVRWCGKDSRGRRIERDEIPIVAEKLKKFFRGEEFEEDRLGRLIPREKIKNSILIPKYYDPEVERALEELRESHHLITFGDLVRRGAVEVSAGVEVGKLAYGTGQIPFIRTSDIVNWEVRIDPTHSVSEEIYNKWKDKCPDLKPEDILMVRDGTYLVGNTAMITEEDIVSNPKMLFQAEILRIRVLDRDSISPYLLFGILNSPIVRRQIRCKQFTRGVIDTLGDRIDELVLPIPKDETRRLEIERGVREIIEKRSEYRRKMRDLINTAIPKHLDYKWKFD
jgi:type I restriction enzyme M protein